MNYFLLKLAFDTAVHFGGSDSAVGSQSSALTLRADTIFSALCHTALEVYGEPALEELLVSADADALRIRADARLAAATLAAGQSAEYPLGRVRKGYLVAARGRIEVNGVLAAERDGVAIAEEEVVRVTALEDSEVVLVDVA